MQLKVASPWPNLRGVYVETDRFEGRPAYVKRSPASICNARQGRHGPAGVFVSSSGDASETWIFFSAKFGSSPCWQLKLQVRHSLHDAS